jgi:hypothetical protein
MRIQINVIREPARPHRRRRTFLTVAVAALVLFVPFALASDVFTDVPSSHPFHDQINRAYAAGMIGACGASTFCPGNTVTKGMAANQYDKAFGLDGTPRPFTPTWRQVNVVTGGATPPFTVDSAQKVANLNADRLDGHDSTDFLSTVTVRSKEGTIPVNQIGSVQADCDTGSYATGGGGELVGGNAAQVNWIDTGVPIGDPPTGWRMKLLSPTANSQTIRVWVICVS